MFIVCVSQFVYVYLIVRCLSVAQFVLDLLSTPSLEDSPIFFIYSITVDYLFSIFLSRRKLASDFKEKRSPCSFTKSASVLAQNCFGTFFVYTGARSLELKLTTTRSEISEPTQRHLLETSTGKVLSQAVALIQPALACKAVAPLPLRHLLLVSGGWRWWWHWCFGRCWWCWGWRWGWCGSRGY